MNNEAERIQREYARRESGDFYQTIYAPFSDFSIYDASQRDRLFGAALRQANLLPLHNRTILEAGCGYGEYLIHLTESGAKPENLHGIDLIPERIDHAKAQHPAIDFRAGSAETLPYDDSSFDVVYQINVFSSILDRDMRRKIAREMQRVLKPEGILMWYDLHRRSKSDALVNFRREDIAALFPELRIISAKQTALRFGLRRRLTRFSPELCGLLERFPALCDVLFAVLRKQAEHDD